MKIKLGVFFGGKSVEHEVSIITALQAIENINKEKYDIVPIYIAKDNKMYCGDFVDDYAIDEQYRNDLSALFQLQLSYIPSEDGRSKLVHLQSLSFDL